MLLAPRHGFIAEAMGKEMPKNSEKVGLSENRRVEMDAIGKMLEQKRIEVVLPYIKGELLDIGCGLNHLVRRYDRGVGVDVFDWGDVDVVVKDSAHLHFPDKKFDTITVIAALNHIPNRKEVLKECERLLADDGELIISMIPPLISKIWHNFRASRDFDQKKRGMKQGEVYGLTKKQLVGLAEECGFELAECHTFMLVNTLYIFKKH